MMHGSARSLSAGEGTQEPCSPGPDDPAQDRLEGAPLCLETLYRQESPRLLRSMARKTSSRDEARDLVHEIFCRVARLGAAGALRLERPQAYLSRVASNLLRDRAKQAARRKPENQLSADDVMLSGPDPHRLLESRDMLARVEAAMLRLRPKTREIFVAHRIDGLSYSQIAERTGLSVKGVEKQMSKAIAHIDRLLERD